MEREVFVEQLKTASSVIDDVKCARVLLESIDAFLCDGNPRGHKNFIIATEELMELGIAISKVLRGKGDRVNVLEELADVCIGVRYIQELCNITNEELCKAINVKIDNVERTLAENGVYK